MFLQLVVDRDYGVAYKRQAVPDSGGDVPDAAAQRSPTAGSRPCSWSICAACSAAPPATATRPSSSTAGNWSKRSRITWPSGTTNQVDAERAAPASGRSAVQSDILLRTAGAGPVPDLARHRGPAARTAAARAGGVPGSAGDPGDNPSESADASRKDGAGMTVAEPAAPAVPVRAGQPTGAAVAGRVDATGELGRLRRPPGSCSPKRQRC